MPLTTPGPRPARAFVVAVLAGAIAACSSITGDGGGNAFATVKGKVTVQGGDPSINQSVSVVCPVIGRGQFGSIANTDGTGSYSLDIDVPSKYVDDVKFASWEMPCYMFSPAVNGRSPDTTETVRFSGDRSSAPVTTIDFATKP